MSNTIRLSDSTEDLPIDHPDPFREEPWMAEMLDQLVRRLWSDPITLRDESVAPGDVALCSDQIRPTIQSSPPMYQGFDQVDSVKAYRHLSGDPIRITWSGDDGQPPGCLHLMANVPPGPNNNCTIGRSFYTNQLGGKTLSIDVKAVPYPGFIGIVGLLVVLLQRNDRTLLVQNVIPLFPNGWNTFTTEVSPTLDPIDYTALLFSVIPAPVLIDCLEVLIDNIDFTDR